MQRDTATNSQDSEVNYKNLSFRHKFSNWLWHDNHAAFSEESLLPGAIKNPSVIRALRFFNLLISAADYALQIGTNMGSLKAFGHNYIFFTIWGMTLTLAANILA